MSHSILDNATASRIYNRLAVQVIQLSIEHAQLTSLCESGPLAGQTGVGLLVNEIGKIIRDLQAITMQLPLGVRVFEAVTAIVGEERYLIELARVAETVRPAATDVSIENGVEFLTWRGGRLPVMRLAELLGRNPARKSLTSGVLVVIPRAQGGALAIFVDDLRETQQILLKPLSGDLRMLPGMAGGAVLNDGSAVLVLDLGQVLEAAA